jgi:3-isopropylmalate/(R)-2-methylmalate dehydratase small subunit
LLPVVLKEEIIEHLFGLAAGSRALEVEVNLETQRLSVETADDIPFEIEPGRKEALILGLDDIGMTFMHSDEILEFEIRHRQAMPWIFNHD